MASENEELRNSWILDSNRETARTTIYLFRDQMEEAKRAGINISEVCRNALDTLLEDDFTVDYREMNRKEDDLLSKLSLVREKKKEIEKKMKQKKEEKRSAVKHEIKIMKSHGLTKSAIMDDLKDKYEIDVINEVFAEVEEGSSNA